VLLNVNSLAANGVGGRTRHGARASPRRGINDPRPRDYATMRSDGG